MSYCEFCGRQHNVGFVSTRFAGTDGVSLETAKWADVFEGVGFSCFYFAGSSIDPPRLLCLSKKLISSIHKLKTSFVTVLARG